jgi:undecaprenyl-diphosphatase
VATIILRNRWPKLTIPLVAFAILTCYSRPYFGMHYPLDVIIGAVLGVAAGFATLAIESYWKHKSESRTK